MISHAELKIFLDRTQEILDEFKLLLRGTGHTTAQMKAAPRGAVYVWGKEDLGYPLALASHLRRDDLIIVAPSMIEEICRGRRAAVVVDHATELHSRHLRHLRAMEPA
jgi:tRNA(Leu) C34 or U34 (ribose-2'-O)-methylase TrmL